jgi:hypothetical protein
MDRQEMEESADVTMLFAMKWFNSDLTNKGMNSDLVKGLLLSTAELKEQKKQERTKPKTLNELMALCYLSYLETNNYLKCD